MTREDRRKALRRAFDTGPEPYAHLDVRLATKLGGALFLIGIAYVLIVLPLAPPDRGAIGWAGVITCVALAVGSGVTMLRWPRPMHPDTLLALTYGGIAMAATYRWAAGEGAPFHQMLLLACLYGSAVHPARRACGVLAATTLAAISPALYGDTGDGFVPLLAGHLALTWSLGVLILVWTARVRTMRREVSEAREHADQLARIDPLSGLGNRRALEEALPVAVAAARRAGQPLSLIMTDLDDFKGINDVFGHHAGDDLIKAATETLTGSVRIPDPCFRWGGDEFVALLPGADLAMACHIAERVSLAVSATCTRPDGSALSITVGAAELRDGETGEALVGRADSELLSRKGLRGARSLLTAG